MSTNPCVKEIWQVDGQTLGIQWTDQKESKLDVSMLREKCPCATCKEKRARHTAVSAQGVRPVAITSVGRYALNISFSDAHNTGIYTFDFLRSL